MQPIAYLCKDLQWHTKLADKSCSTRCLQRLLGPETFTLVPFVIKPIKAFLCSLQEDAEREKERESRRGGTIASLSQAPSTAGPEATNVGFGLMHGDVMKRTFSRTATPITPKQVSPNLIGGTPDYLEFSTCVGSGGGAGGVGLLIRAHHELCEPRCIHAGAAANHTSA